MSAYVPHTNTGSVSSYIILLCGTHVTGEETLALSLSTALSCAWIRREMANNSATSGARSQAKMDYDYGKVFDESGCRSFNGSNSWLIIRSSLKTHRNQNCSTAWRWSRSTTCGNLPDKLFKMSYWRDRSGQSLSSSTSRRSSYLDEH